MMIPAKTKIIEEDDDMTIIADDEMASFGDYTKASSPAVVAETYYESPIGDPRVGRIDVGNTRYHEVVGNQECPEKDTDQCEPHHNDEVIVLKVVADETSNPKDPTPDNSNARRLKSNKLYQKAIINSSSSHAVPFQEAKAMLPRHDEIIDLSSQEEVDSGPVHLQDPLSDSASEHGDGSDYVDQGSVANEENDSSKESTHRKTKRTRRKKKPSRFLSRPQANVPDPRLIDSCVPGPTQRAPQTLPVSFSSPSVTAQISLSSRSGLLPFGLHLPSWSSGSFNFAQNSQLQWNPFLQMLPPTQPNLNAFQMNQLALSSHLASFGCPAPAFPSPNQGSFRQQLNSGYSAPNQGYGWLQLRHTQYEQSRKRPAENSGFYQNVGH